MGGDAESATMRGAESREQHEISGAEERATRVDAARRGLEMRCREVFGKVWLGDEVRRGAVRR